MNIPLIAGLLLAVTLPAYHASAAVILEGKIMSQVLAHVSRPINLIVTDDKGGWFEQGLELIQQGGWETPYQAEARLRVQSSSGDFQVRLDEPLQLRHATDPLLMFRNPEIKLANEGEPGRPLLIGQNLELHNPGSVEPGDDTLGYYNLSISALPPAGDFKSTTGSYMGVLSLTFEPVVKAP